MANRGTRTISLTTPAGTFNLGLVIFDESDDTYPRDGYAILPHDPVLRPVDEVGGWDLSGFTTYTIGAGKTYADIETFIATGPDGDAILEGDVGSANVIVANWTMDNRRTGRTVVQPTSYAGTFTQGVRVRPTVDDASLLWLRGTANTNMATSKDTQDEWWFRACYFDVYTTNGKTGSGHFQSVQNGALIPTGLFFEHCMFEGDGAVSGIDAVNYGIIGYWNQLGVYDSTFSGYQNNNGASGRHSGAVQWYGGSGCHLDNIFAQAAGVTIRCGFGPTNGNMSNHPKHFTLSNSHIYGTRNSTTWKQYKGAVEFKSIIYGLVEGNHVDGLLMMTSGDPSNVIGIGTKGIGGGSASQQMIQTTCVTVRWNIITNIPKSAGYINNQGGTGKTMGCQNITYHDNLVYDMWQSGDTWTNSTAASASTTYGFSIYGATVDPGFKGPHNVIFDGNTIYNSDAATVVKRTLDKSNIRWEGDSGPSTSRINDNNFAMRTADGVHNTGGDPQPPIAAGEEWGGLEMEYNTFNKNETGTADAGWPASNIEHDTPNRIDGYMDGNYDWTAAGITALETAHGVGAGGKICSETPRKKMDNTTFVPDRPGANITELTAIFGDVNAPNVNSSPSHIRYP